MTDLSRDVRDSRERRLPEDLTADLLRFAAALVTLVAAIILGLARVT
jgi:hypothetical protein